MSSTENASPVKPESIYLDDKDYSKSINDNISHTKVSNDGSMYLDDMEYSKSLCAHSSTVPYKHHHGNQTVESISLNDDMYTQSIAHESSSIHTQASLSLEAAYYTHSIQENDLFHLYMFKDNSRQHSHPNAINGDEQEWLASLEIPDSTEQWNAEWNLVPNKDFLESSRLESSPNESSCMHNQSSLSLEEADYSQSFHENNLFHLYMFQDNSRQPSHPNAVEIDPEQWLVSLEIPDCTEQWNSEWKLVQNKTFLESSFLVASEEPNMA